MSAPTRVLRRVDGDLVMTEGQAPKATDWKALCEETKRRLDIAEASLKETRVSADEMRSRMQKYKQRLDSAQSENNRLQARVVELTSQAEAQAERLARLDAIRRHVHEFRQSILDGPLWDLFVDLTP